MRYILYIPIFFLICGLSYVFQLDYKYEDIKDYIGLLSGISGMIFTIMGIWIAFIYPNALNRLANPSKIENADFSETLNETKRLEAIVAAILKSSIVAVFLALIVFVKIFLWKSRIYSDNPLAFKSIVLGITSICTFTQIEAVLSVIFANIMFINDLHQKRRDRQSDGSC